MAAQTHAQLIAHIDRQFAAAGSVLHTKFQYDLENPEKLEKKRRHSTDKAEPQPVAVPKAEISADA